MVKGKFFGRLYIELSYIESTNNSKTCINKFMRSLYRLNIYKTYPLTVEIGF